MGLRSGLADCARRGKAIAAAPTAAVSRNVRRSMAGEDNRCVGRWTNRGADRVPSVPCMTLDAVLEETQRRDLKATSVILYDGVCGLCNRGVRFVLKRDRKGVFRFASLQSSAGR